MGGAKENNAMGTMFGLDKETPEFTYQKDAQKLMNNKLYKADYEKETKGQGLTFDLHGTPMMQHIKQAELIKSERAYKKDYVENQLGKPTGMLTNTLMKTAAKASDILSDIKYKRDAVMDEASSILDTPEMRKVKNAQTIVSDIEYRKELGEMKGKLTANSQIVLDTPELRRVRKSQRNISNAKYKDEIKLNTAFAGLDTPAMRLAKKNKRNYSKVNYEADKQYLKGKVTCVANDLITQHIRHAEDLRDDRVYKGLVAGKTAAAMTRQAQEETWAMWESQHRPPARSHSALGHRPSTAAAQYHQAAAHRQDTDVERPSSVMLIQRPLSVDQQKAKQSEQFVSKLLQPKTPKKSGQENEFEYERSASALDDGPTGVQYERTKWQGRTSYMMDRPGSAMESRRPSSAMGAAQSILDGSKSAMRPQSAMGQQVSFSPYVHSASQAQMDVAGQRAQSAMAYRSSKTSKKSKNQYGYSLDVDETTKGGMKKKAQVQQTFNRKTLSWSEFKDTPRGTTPTSLHGQDKSAELSEVESEAPSEAAEPAPQEPAAPQNQWTAIYDYVASDDDELTFKDGDTIVNAQNIADGWMYGTLASTGQSGLLPSNYVQAAA